MFCAEHDLAQTKLTTRQCSKMENTELVAGSKCHQLGYLVLLVYLREKRLRPVVSGRSQVEALEGARCVGTEYISHHAIRKITTSSMADCLCCGCLKWLRSIQLQKVPVLR